MICFCGVMKNLLTIYFNLIYSPLAPTGIINNFTKIIHLNYEKVSKFSPALLSKKLLGNRLSFPVVLRHHAIRLHNVFTTKEA